jgi:hypothetical protein
MKFRLKAFALHLAASALVLALVLGALYLGWYRWPGWYLTGALKIAGMMVLFDLILGPLLTLVVANPKKPTRELARDISIIAIVQLIALGYGTVTMWHGRVLYYTYSTRWLEVVQASDISEEQIERAFRENPRFAPHWYSMPQWVYAPLPTDAGARQDIVAGTISGGDDVIQMPRLFRPWGDALPEIRKELKSLASLDEFSKAEKQSLEKDLLRQGEPVERPVAMVMMGKTGPLLAVFDPTTLTLKRIYSPTG